MELLTLNFTIRSVASLLPTLPLLRVTLTSVFIAYLYSDTLLAPVEASLLAQRQSKLYLPRLASGMAFCGPPCDILRRPATRPELWLGFMLVDIYIVVAMKEMADISPQCDLRNAPTSAF